MLVLWSTQKNVRVCILERFKALAYFRITQYALGKSHNVVTSEVG